MSKSVSDGVTPICRYGQKCYRTNAEHLKNFSHSATKVSEMIKPLKREHSDGCAGTSSESSRSTKSSKLAYKTDILSIDDDSFERSAQFSYMIDLPWLIRQYPFSTRNNPLLLVIGQTGTDIAKIGMAAQKAGDHIKIAKIHINIPYGTHHTKLMLLKYHKCMRVVVSTANLVEQDWDQKTQGFYLSPPFPLVETNHSSCSGDISHDSKTGFKHDLIEYLSAYKNKSVNEWIEIVKMHDFSTASVYLIGSVPGRHTGDTKNRFGHLKLRKVLLKYCDGSVVQPRDPVIAQCSSIGSLGPKPESWLVGEFLETLTATTTGLQSKSVSPKAPLLKFIFPSLKNVRDSLEGYAAGASIPYSINTAKKQPYLIKIFHQWSAERTGRSKASPHIKTYGRFKDDDVFWFLLTSANVSKAAWGAYEKSDTQLMIRSFELGVLFLPNNATKCLGNFPVPWDLPPVPYKSGADQPWLWDIPYLNQPDSTGNDWCP